MSVKLLPDLGDLTEGLGVTGIVGIILLPIFLPVIGSVGRPIAKAVVKKGLALYENNKEALEELRDNWEDIIAEAKAEVGEERMKSAQPTDV
ncbi:MULTISPECIES: DUF5132 domain-containing protein [Nostocales]|uniref:DUF5132 domain-containing protein n=1 Tax=Nostocales TaxID=1161 RepID=UPI000CA26E68|nr:MULTISPECIES: DUF5132 domain-containing protein [unclassified Nostoc]AUT01319.1 DUF5132 domain-containing protein [Nostoc sp. CENA543]MCF4967599.1 DUF5132 domain-containing protein [Nostoc sp. CMAA1605]